MLLDGAYCNALLFAYWSVRQELNHVSSVQFISITSLCTRLDQNFRHNVPVNITQYKCTKHQFVRLLTATRNVCHFNNSKKHRPTSPTVNVLLNIIIFFK